MENQTSTPTHVATGYVTVGNYTVTVWLISCGSRWTRYNAPGELRGWTKTTGEATTKDQLIRRVDDVRSMTNQDKREWLQERLDRMKTIVLHGKDDRDNLKRKLDELSTVLEATTQYVLDLELELRKLGAQQLPAESTSGQ